MAQVAEAVRFFFFNQYDGAVLQPLAAAQAGEADATTPGLPQMLPPVLGLVVGGFGKTSYQSELWSIQLPYHSQPNSAVCNLGQGQYASAWFASMAPIHRYIKGVDPGAFQSMVEYFNQIRPELNPAELEELKKRANAAEFSFVFPGMPIAKGVEYVRFLIDLVIGHHKFAAANPIVGGRCRVGYVTFDKQPFKILTEWRK